MKENKKIIKNKVKKESLKCGDEICPIHGNNKLKLRGRTFSGNVIMKFHNKVTIEFIRMIFVSKYERYEKRRTKLHARLPKCMEEEINLGDWIQIAETRPISKTIHFVVAKKIKSEEKEK